MSDTAPVIRPVRPDDVPALRALHAASFEGLAHTHHTADQLAAHSTMVAHPAYAEELLSNNLRVAVDADGRILASAGWRPMPDRPETARIRKVFVAPDLAGRQLGRRLVEAAEADARARGYPNLFVRANANAAAFYERLGYRAIERGSMPAANGVELPVVYMEKPAAG